MVKVETLIVNHSRCCAALFDSMKSLRQLICEDLLISGTWTSLTSLHLKNCRANLTLPETLQDLSLISVRQATDSLISKLTGLTSLKLCDTDITAKSVSLLTNLTHLSIRSKISVGNECLLCLTGLTSLDIYQNSQVTMKGKSNPLLLLDRHLSSN